MKWSLQPVGLYSWAGRETEFSLLLFVCLTYDFQVIFIFYSFYPVLGACSVITERKASKLVDSVPMVNANKAWPIDTTQLLQKCVSFWRLHSQSFCIQSLCWSHHPKPFPRSFFCFLRLASSTQMLILLSVLLLTPFVAREEEQSAFRQRKCCLER